MKRHLVCAGVLAVILGICFGCATSTSKKLNRLELGMSQAQVRNVLGNDYLAKASMTDTNGARLQLWEYTDKKTQDVFRIYFKDGQLAEWGQRGNLDFPVLTVPK